MRSIFFAIVMLTCIGVGNLFAVETNATIPTAITGKKMIYNHARGTVVFEGEVWVDRPDFQLWTDRLTVFLLPKAKNKVNTKKSKTEGMGGTVDRILAEGRVRMEKDGRKGFCDKGTYMMAQGLLVMEGNPRLEEGKNEIKGQVIRFFIKDNRSEVVGGDSRVKAVFFTAPAKELK